MLIIIKQLIKKKNYYSYYYYYTFNWHVSGIFAVRSCAVSEHCTPYDYKCLIFKVASCKNLH